MVTLVVESGQVSVPDWVVDLPSFRKWTDTDEFPEQGRVWWLRGEVWIDLSREQVFSHVLVKTEITRVLGNLAKEGRLGLLLGDGVLVSNAEADISGNPDATFVSTDALREGRVRLIEGAERGVVELEGAPDMVLEVVSRGSVRKDTEVLRRAYAEAGIAEYWLVDTREEQRFDILHLSSRGYTAARKQAGRVRSRVFQRWFRLTLETDALGHPAYTLAVR